MLGACIQRGEADSVPVEAWSPLLNEGTDSLLVVARLRSPNHILRLVIQRFEKSRSRGIVEVVLHAGIGDRWSVCQRICQSESRFA